MYVADISQLEGQTGQEGSLHWSTAKKMLSSLYIFLINLTLRIPNLKSVSVHHIRFLNNTQFCDVNEEDAKSISHCIRYINFVVETSFRAYFK